MSAETQTREVETADHRYVLHPDGSVTAAYLDGSSVDYETASCIRRIAELEEERERIWAVAAEWEADAAEIDANHGPDIEVRETLRHCAEQLRERFP